MILDVLFGVAAIGIVGGLLVVSLRRPSAAEPEPGHEHLWGEAA